MSEQMYRCENEDCGNELIVCDLCKAAKCVPVPASPSEDEMDSPETVATTIRNLEAMPSFKPTPHPKGRGAMNTTQFLSALAHATPSEQETLVETLAKDIRTEFAKELTEDEDGNIGMGLICDDCKVWHCSTDCAPRKLVKL